MTEDEVEAAIQENLRLGYVDIVGEDEDGENLYRLTPAGIEHVEGMLGQ